MEVTTKHPQFIQFKVEGHEKVDGAALCSAAHLDRKCEICKVQLEGELPWCKCCTNGEGSLWGRMEQLKISSGEGTVMSILTLWSQEVPSWNLQQVWKC